MMFWIEQPTVRPQATRSSCEVNFFFRKESHTYFQTYLTLLQQPHLPYPRPKPYSVGPCTKDWMCPFFSFTYALPGNKLLLCVASVVKKSCIVLLYCIL